MWWAEGENYVSLSLCFSSVIWSSACSLCSSKPDIKHRSQIWDVVQEDGHALAWTDSRTHTHVQVLAASPLTMGPHLSLETVAKEGSDSCALRSNWARAQRASATFYPSCIFRATFSVRVQMKGGKAHTLACVHLCMYEGVHAWVWKIFWWEKLWVVQRVMWKPHIRNWCNSISPSHSQLPSLFKPHVIYENVNNCNFPLWLWIRSCLHQRYTDMYVTVVPPATCILCARDSTFLLYAQPYYWMFSTQFLAVEVTNGSLCWTLSIERKDIGGNEQQPQQREKLEAV